MIHHIFYNKRGFKVHGYLDPVSDRYVHFSCLDRDLSEFVLESDHDLAIQTDIAKTRSAARKALALARRARRIARENEREQRLRNVEAKCLADAVDSALMEEKPKPSDLSNRFSVPKWVILQALSAPSLRYRPGKTNAGRQIEQTRSFDRRLRAGFAEMGLG